MSKKGRKKSIVGKAVDKAKQTMSSTSKPEVKESTALAVSSKKEITVAAAQPASVKTEAKAEEKKESPTTEKTATKAPAKKTTTKTTAAKKNAKAATKTAPAKKETTEKKPATRKPAAKQAGNKKVAAPTFETFLEYNGEQINVTPEAIRARVEEAYKAEGHRTGNIKTMQVYLNLEERRAYYVINGKPENKFVGI